MGDFLASLSGISRMSQYLDTAIYLGNGNSLNMFCWNMDFGMFSMLHSSIKLVKYLKYIMWCRVDSHGDVGVK